MSVSYFPAYRELFLAQEIEIGVTAGAGVNDC